MMYAFHSFVFNLCDIFRRISCKQYLTVFIFQFESLRLLIDDFNSIMSPITQTFEFIRYIMFLIYY